MASIFLEIGGLSQQKVLEMVGLESSKGVPLGPIDRAGAEIRYR